MRTGTKSYNYYGHIIRANKTNTLSLNGIITENNMNCGTGTYISLELKTPETVIVDKAVLSISEI